MKKELQTWGQELVPASQEMHLGGRSAVGKRNRNCPLLVFALPAKGKSYYSSVCFAMERQSVKRDGGGCPGGLWILGDEMRYWRTCELELLPPFSFTYALEELLVSTK